MTFPAEGDPVDGDWGGFGAVLAAGRAEAAAIRAHGLQACPLCGEPLEQARGVLHCPFDGSTYPA